MEIVTHLKTVKITLKIFAVCLTSKFKRLDGKSMDFLIIDRMNSLKTSAAFYFPIVKPTM